MAIRQIDGFLPPNHNEAVGSVFAEQRLRGRWQEVMNEGPVHVTVIIGAMVIAPLLGPNVALALATTLGDRDLAARALRVAAAGFGVAFGLSFAAGVGYPHQLQSFEILSRTVV